MDGTVETTIQQLLAAMGYSGASIAQTEAAGQKIFSIEGVADSRDLIGMRGETIQAIDTLVKKIVEKNAEAKAPVSEAGETSREPIFLVDVDGYRGKQIKDLQTKARMMAERARSFQYDVELSPMSSYERLIIHTTLQSEPNVKTESQGEGRNRRVVIKYSAQ